MPARKKQRTAKRRKKAKSASVTTRSTAGPGFVFEDQIGAYLLLQMPGALPGSDFESGEASRSLGFRPRRAYSGSDKVEIGGREQRLDGRRYYGGIMAFEGDGRIVKHMFPVQARFGAISPHYFGVIRHQSPYRLLAFDNWALP
jgi:hypothetical protein